MVQWDCMDPTIHPPKEDGQQPTQTASKDLLIPKGNGAEEVEILKIPQEQTTPLFHAIEKDDWRGVFDFLQKGNWDACGEDTTDDRQIKVQDRNDSATVAKNWATKEELESIQAHLKSMYADLMASRDGAASKASSEEVATLRKDLKTMYADLKAAKMKEITASNEVKELKEELKSLKKRMTKMDAFTETKNDIRELKESLERELRHARGANKAELNIMKKSLDVLQYSVNKAKVTDDVVGLKKEVDALKTEMTNFYEAKTKEDVEELKKTLAKQMKASQGATREELKKMKLAVDKMWSDIKEADNREELLALKGTVDEMKAAMSRHEEAAQTKKDVEQLRKMLEKEVKEANGLAKNELASLKQVVDKLHGKVNSTTTLEQIDDLKSELTRVKNEMLKQEESARTRKNVEQFTVEQIKDLKEELDVVKKEMIRQEEAAKTKKDVEDLRKALEVELMDSRGQTKMELANLKQCLDTMHAEMQSKKTVQEIDNLKKDLAHIKKEMKAAAKLSQLKVEMMELKKSIESDLANCEEIMTEIESAEITEAISFADEKELDEKTADELHEMKTGLETLKKSMHQKGVHVPKKKSGLFSRFRRKGQPNNHHSSRVIKQAVSMPLSDDASVDSTVMASMKKISANRKKSKVAKVTPDEANDGSISDSSDVPAEEEEQKKKKPVKKHSWQQEPVVETRDQREEDNMDGEEAKVDVEQSEEVEVREEKADEDDNNSNEEPSDEEQSNESADGSVSSAGVNKHQGGKVNEAKEQARAFDQYEIHRSQTTGTLGTSATSGTMGAGTETLVMSILSRALAEVSMAASRSEVGGPRSPSN